MTEKNEAIENNSPEQLRDMFKPGEGTAVYLEQNYKLELGRYPDNIMNIAVKNYYKMHESEDVINIDVHEDGAVEVIEDHLYRYGSLEKHPKAQILATAIKENNFEAISKFLEAAKNEDNQASDEAAANSASVEGVLASNQ